MRYKLHISRSILALTTTLFAAGCGGGDGSGTTPGTFTVDGLVQDAPIDDLSSFSATVDSVRLVTGGGATTPNLLDGSVRVEWLGLDGIGAWLFQHRPPQGTFTAVRVVLDPGSLVARDAA